MVGRHGKKKGPRRARSSEDRRLRYQPWVFAGFGTLLNWAST
jgi:hypothetical protein